MRRAFFALISIAAAWPLACLAQPSAAKSSPLSAVQLEKLVKIVEAKGQNVGLNPDVSRTLKLSDGTPALIREVKTADMTTGKRYTFGLVIGRGLFLTTVSDGSSPRLFVFDENLKILTGLKTGFGLEPMDAPEAEAGGRDTLEQFSGFIDMN